MLAHVITVKKKFKSKRNSTTHVFTTIKNTNYQQLRKKQLKSKIVFFTLNLFLMNIFLKIQLANKNN